MDESEKHSKATGDDEEPLEDVKIDGVEELQDDIIEEVDVLYVSADDDIPEIAQEVITDGEYVEVVDEELLQPSSDPTHLVSNLEALRAGKHEAQLQWDYINTNLHASPVSQVASAGLDRRFVPKYPVSVARNCAVPSKQGPYLSAAPILNQRKTMLAYDLLASLPEEKRGHFIEFVDLLDKRLLCDPKFLSMPAANTLLRNSSRDCEEKVQYLSLSALDSCVSERIVDSTKQGTEISHEGETDPKEERVEERFVMTKRVDHFFKEGTATGQGRGVVEQGSVRFCPSCRMMLKRAIYYHHGRLIRKYGRCDIFTPKRFPCGDPGCHERLGTIEKLCDHMYQVHRAPTMIKHRVFNNEAEFQEFLIDLESSGNYRMPRGNKTVKGATVQYYRCNRMYSIPKSKITRLIDGIAAGDCYGNKSYANPMNPFEKETSTKPFLRTEGACTAFLRKSYLDNGKIQVRYCDYHLHSDDGVRLPRAIRSRIFEMTAKKLPAPVIVMVLRKECHQFCSPGSSLERRIMSITPREVHLTSLSFKRMLQKNEKNAIHKGADHEKMWDDCHTFGGISEFRENEGYEEDTENNVCIDEDGHGEEGELTMLELATLEEYERDRGSILTQFQNMRREENRKRLLRERVRAEVYTIGRIMRNVRFANFNYDLLLRSHEILRVLLDSWNEDMDEGKTCGNSDESVPQRGSGEASVGTSLPWNASTVNANGQDTDNKEDSANVTDTVLTGSSRKKSMVKRSVYCHVSPAVKAPQEPREEGHTDPALPRREPLAVTRLGRVVKRKKILDL